MGNLVLNSLLCPHESCVLLGRTTEDCTPEEQVNQNAPHVVNKIREQVTILFLTCQKNEIIILKHRNGRKVSSPSSHYYI